MIVWHLPEDGRGQNLYGRLLRKAMRARGVAMTGVPYSPFFSLQALAHRPDVMHFEFITPFILPHAWPRAAPIAVVKGTLFVVQAMLLRLAGIRLVWTIHNLVNHERRLENVEWFFSLIFTRIAHVLVAHGHGSRDAVVARYHLSRISYRVHAMPHPSYIGAYPDDVGRSDARVALGVGARARMFLVLGQLRSYKNIPGVIDAFTRTADQAGGSELWIVGAPIDRAVVDEIRRRAEGRADIKLVLEHVPDDRLQLYLNACDFVVLNYAIASSGVAVLAMSFGRAVIAPEAASLVQTLDAQGTIFFDRHDSRGLDQAMRRAGALAERSAEMGACNARRAAAWSWYDAATHFAAWYAPS